MTTKRKYQPGVAHLAIVVIIILLILGLLGAVAYKAFSTRPDTDYKLPSASKKVPSPVKVENKADLIKSNEQIDSLDVKTDDSNFDKAANELK